MATNALRIGDTGRQPALFSPDIETMPRKQLQRLQFDRLRRTLHHAYANVPHYRRCFDAAGVKPFEIRGLADLRCFPFISKADSRIRRITGRSDDMLIVRGVNVCPSQLEAVLVGLPRNSPHYQLVVERKGPLDQVMLEVEAQPAVTTDEARCQSIAQTVSHHSKSLLGISCDVVVKRPGEVPRSQGKAARVRDLRPMP
jgi:phenylacetate-coenzyme A ligase PaaK-like adenylate-forming protein